MSALTFNLVVALAAFAVARIPVPPQPLPAVDEGLVAQAVPPGPPPVFFQAVNEHQKVLTVQLPYERFPFSDEPALFDLRDDFFLYAGDNADVDGRAYRLKNFRITDLQDLDWYIECELYPADEPYYLTRGTTAGTYPEDDSMVTVKSGEGWVHWNEQHSMHYIWADTLECMKHRWADSEHEASDE